MSVTTESVRGRVISAYRAVQQDVAEREAATAEQQPVDETPIALHQLLDRPPQSWNGGEKALRTVPVAVAFEEHLGRELADWKINVMAGLDAYINCADDSIDSRPNSTVEQVELEFNKAQALRMVYEHVPQEHQNEAFTHISNYLTDVYSIPGAEPAMVEHIQARDNGPDIEAAADLYEHQARDIDGFIEIAAVGTNLDGSYDRLKNDLRTYRAHNLLFDDIVDVEQDLDDGDRSAIIALTEKYPDGEQLSSYVDTLYEDFEYSEESNGEYREQLKALENRPERMNQELSDLLPIVTEY